MGEKIKNILRVAITILITILITLGAVLYTDLSHDEKIFYFLIILVIALFIVGGYVIHHIFPNRGVFRWKIHQLHRSEFHTSVRL